MTIATAFADRPLPLIDADNEAFFEGTAAGVLRLQQCETTGRFQHYPRPMSCATGGPTRWVEASGRGHVYSFSIVRQNFAQPAFHAHAPYVVALIELEEGVRMMGNIIETQVDAVSIGAAVRVDFLRVDPNGTLTLPVWKLVMEGDH